MRCSGVEQTFASLSLWVLHPDIFSGVYASSFSPSFWISTNYLPDDDLSNFFEDSFSFSFFFDEYPECLDVSSYPAYIGDGYCDLDNNKDECGYDGGDCCMCTCKNTELFKCGEAGGGYLCLDPDVSGECREDSNSHIQPYSSTSGDSLGQYPGCIDAGGWAQGIGDGYCDSQNSNEECAYDGGDCCSCTCVDTSEHTCGSDGEYHCKDPSVSDECMEESASHITHVSSSIDSWLNQYPDCNEARGWIPSIGDGFCDYYNSIEECGYDGGDCCSCTCVDGEWQTCGKNSYLCRDPTVPTECREDSGSHIPSSSSSSYWYRANQYPDCIAAGGYLISVGDAHCDRYNNVEECGYDDGDCCVCTCEDSELARCGEHEPYSCVDPNVSQECKNESEIAFPSSSTSWPLNVEYAKCYLAGGDPNSIGDGYCNSGNNNEKCGYDGGDCCSCTCVDTTYTTCGEQSGFSCLDPAVSAECEEESTSSYISFASSSLHSSREKQYPKCNDAGGSISGIGDGKCNVHNSIHECAYDGGDCCSCTCISKEGNTCGGSVGYQCEDPSVSETCREESASYTPIVPPAHSDDLNP